MKKILLATNNLGKVERFRKLLVRSGLEFELVTPGELGLAEIDVVEDGQTLVANAEIKVRAYFGKVDIPVLANDTGFWIEGEGLVIAPKRQALAGADESHFSKAEMAEKLLSFWKKKASDHGGEVNAAWRESFVLLKPDGALSTADSIREVILTDREFGEVPQDMPVRALYISKITNKPAILHTEAEEWAEMQPIADALKKLLGNI